MTKPVWYLDVDGVLNVWPNFESKEVTPEEFRRSGTANGYRINWDSRVPDFINKVSREGLVEVVWATTWEHLAAEHIAPLLGLDEFRITNRRRDHFDYRMEMGWNGNWWKFPVVRDDFERQGPDARMIWTDDDLGISLRSDEHLRKFIGSDPNKKLAIAPYTGFGLTQEALAKIEQFLLGKDISNDSKDGE